MELHVFREIRIDVAFRSLTSGSVSLAVKVVTFEHDCHGFESSHRQSAPPHTNPPLTAAPSPNMMCTLISLTKEKKR